MGTTLDDLLPTSLVDHGNMIITAPSHPSFAEEEAHYHVLGLLQTNICQACGRSEGVSRCGRCRLAGFCSKTCQTKTWSAHKKVCLKPQERAKKRIKELTQFYSGRPATRELQGHHCDSEQCTNEVSADGLTNCCYQCPLCCSLFGGTVDVVNHYKSDHPLHPSLLIGRQTSKPRFGPREVLDYDKLAYFIQQRKIDLYFPGQKGQQLAPGLWFFRSLQKLPDSNDEYMCISVIPEEFCVSFYYDGFCISYRDAYRELVGHGVDVPAPHELASYSFLQVLAALELDQSSE